MKEQYEFLDRDFLGNEIDVGDRVIFEAPGYRSFVIGTVITKAPKSCQVEYMNDWNYGKPGVKLVVRQCYGQIIKYPIAKEGKWITTEEELKNTACSNCGHWVETPYGETNYCPNCGARMLNEVQLCIV